LHIVHSVCMAAAKRRATVLVGLDISVTFDTINHDILIEAQFLYLRGSVHICQADNSSSNFGHHSPNIMLCDSGVPQGSVLVPLLSTAYVAPVSKMIDSFCLSHHHFADDFHLVVHHHGSCL